MKALLLALLVIGWSCNKEEMQQNAVVTAMTTGQWKMVSFKSDTTNLTADFAPYLFQFLNNGSVLAIRNGAAEKSGSWSADAAARTISSAFINGGATLELLNGTWKITDNSWTYVVANMTVNNAVRTLRLEKN